jgi:condensin complex subunit 1
MIKVKGQISYLVLALNDPKDHDERIMELARLFFIKLSERSNNPVFNLLGDIISNFSQDYEFEMSSNSNNNNNTLSVENGMILSPKPIFQLSTEEFQKTMHFLLSFVQKEKHADMLLERLLIRLGSAESLLQKQNIAYCISELHVTEKGLKKLL